MTRSLADPDEIKYFISNASGDTSIETLLLVAFSRWKIERMFEDGKGELGMDHFEVRRYLSVRRHLILSCVSYLFLAEFQAASRGKKTGVDGGPGAAGDLDAGADLDAWGSLFAAIGRVDQPPTDPHPASQRQGRTQPPQNETASLARDRVVPEGLTHVSMEPFVAL